MLKKINRLSKSKEFKHVKDRGYMVRTPLFGLIWLREDTGKKSGFIISKKISKRAVDRNRIKRVLAEAIMNHLMELPEGFRGIFLVTRQMLGQKYVNVEKEIKKIQFPKE